MEELTIEEEATVLFEAILRRSVKCNAPVIVYYSERYQKVVANVLSVIKSKATRQALADGTAKVAGRYSPRSSRQRAIREIAEFMRQAKHWGEKAKRKRDDRRDDYLIALTPEQWRDANWPLMVRLGGQTNVA